MTGKVLQKMERAVEDLDAMILRSLGGEIPESRWRDWVRRMSADDELIRHLIEQDVFRSDSERTLGLVKKGYLKLPSADSLFKDGGKSRLLELVAERAAAETESGRTRSPAPAWPPQEGGTTADELTPTRPKVEVNHDDSDQPLTLLVGQTLGKCLLTEQIGRGAHSVVFRALHRSLQIPVAVKVLRADQARQERVGRFFEREARLLARLSHPGILRILDFEVTDKLVYLILEFVDGMSFSELMKQSEIVSTGAVLRIAESISAALEYAASEGVIHRDVKPANILLDKSGNARLADLGVAAIESNLQRLSGSADSIAGTLAYMAPEQLSADARVDWRSDVFSLGATLYHALTGVTPYQSRNPVSLVMEHRTRQPMAPRAWNSAVSPGLSGLIMQMIAVDPGQRPHSWSRVRETVESLRLKEADQRDSSRRRSSGSIIETASSLSMSGELAGDGLSQILQFLSFNNRSGTLYVSGPSLEDGGMTLREGRVLHAWSESVEGNPAFQQLLGLTDGRFAFSRELDEDVVTIDLPVVSLLLEQARQTDEAIDPQPE